MDLGSVVGVDKSSAAAWRAVASMDTRPPTLAEVREAEVREEEVLAEVQAGLEQLDRVEVAGIGPKVVTWARLQEETKASLQGLVDVIQGEVEEWPKEFARIAGYRDNLTVVDGVAMYRDRPVIPPTLRPEVLATLHSGHQGVTSMVSRASGSVWWPGINEDIKVVRSGCRTCDANTPSQPKEPPAPLPGLQYPFQQVCADYFTLEAREYLVIVDRYSGWPSVHQARRGDAKELVSILRSHCGTFGAPEVLTTDGGPQLVARETEDFLKTWGITHRISSAYNPHGNTRAELGVKSMKRMVRSNLGPGGSLETDSFSQALMEYRNTPDRDTGRSPAQVVFGRQLRDFIPVSPGKYQSRREWLLTQEEREKALCRRHLVKGEELSRGVKVQTPLALGTVVRIQNQRGPHKLKWDKSGVVVEALGNSQYKVKVDGSGRITLRNRIFLKRITPYAQVVEPGVAREDLQRNDFQGQVEPGPIREEAPGGASREVVRTTSEETLEEGAAGEAPREATREEGTSPTQAGVKRGTRERRQTLFYRA